MKILNIMTSNLHYNGIGMSLLNYYNYIDKNKIRMDYLVPNKVADKLKFQFTKNGNQLFEFDYHGKKMHQSRPLLYCIKLYKLIKKEHYDIVHVHGSSSLMFMQLFCAKLAGVKIRIAHSRNTDTDHKKLNILFKPLFNLLYTNAFACGLEAGEWLFGKGKEFTIIPNGKDSNMFGFDAEKRNLIRNQYNLNGKIVLGHVGNFVYQKNHEFLIDVFNELCKERNNYCLFLAGKGDLKNLIMQKVNELGLEKKVVFLGQISIEETADILNAMDIMIFPSRFEGFPNVLIEWQMNGLPCIISDKITKDVKLTDLVNFESIDSVDNWVNRIVNLKLYDRDLIKNDVIKKIKEVGYDINDNAAILEREYQELYEKILYEDKCFCRNNKN